MKRDAFFDNAKLLLIFLVVFGHMIQPFIEDSYMVKTLYMWIYTFSMPTFIFLAGFFAKGSGNKTYIINLAKKLLLPYFIFQLLYTGYYFFIGKTAWQTNIFQPHWSLWFLFSLFSWHILLYWFKKMPPYISIMTAVLLGLMIGYIDDIGNAFSLSRTFAFFPFFLTGYWITKKQLKVIKTRQIKIVSIIIMGVVAGAIYIAPDFNSGWLLASKSYYNLGEPIYGGLSRLLVYATSTLMGISSLVWISTKQNKITYLGTRTLYVYLLHGFFIQFFREADLFQINNVIDLLGIGIISAGIVFILSTKPIIFVWKPLIELKLPVLPKYLRDS